MPTIQRIEMPTLTVKLRSAALSDLDAVNRVIEAAVMTWKLPERVKRLSLPGYRYTTCDCDYLEMVVAEDVMQNIIGVAAWEQADVRDNPAGQSALLLHGLCIDPAYHRQRIGHQLFRIAEEAALKQQYGGLLVKAQADANGFFIAQGMKRLQVEYASRHYAYRFWKSADGLRNRGDSP